MNSSTRVLHVANGEVYAGAERVQDLLASQLPRHGYEVGFACIKPGLFPQRRHYREAPLVEVPMRSRFDWACARRIAALVKQDGYALVHTHTARSALIGRIASALAGVPMVHHVHSPTTRDTESAWRNRVNQSAAYFSLLGVRDLIAVSRSLEHYLHSVGLAGRRIHVIPNGVPSRGPLPDRQPPASDWVIGMVALFRPRKGLEVLLQALATLRARGRPARVLAIGPFETPAYEQEIMALVHRLGLEDAVEWTGFVSDVDAQFRRMDLFALPSLYGEGMPMVLLEALAHGVASVATDVEGVVEVLDDGRSGLVVPPSDSQALCEALDRLLSDPMKWKSMREQAHARHSERFSEVSMTANVARVYDEVLGRT